MKYAYIETSRHEIPYSGGNYYETYKWVGGRHLPIRVYDFPVKLLPWKLKRVEFRQWDGVGIFIRQDSFFAWFYWLKVKLLNAWLWFFCRFIITLNIWGLAYTNPACVPSWKDIGKKRA